MIIPFLKGHHVIRFKALYNGIYSLENINQVIMCNMNAFIIGFYVYKSFVIYYDRVMIIDRIDADVLISFIFRNVEIFIVGLESKF